jgi:hypothetical protein
MTATPPVPMSGIGADCIMEPGEQDDIVRDLKRMRGDRPIETTLQRYRKYTSRLYREHASAVSNSLIGAIVTGTIMTNYPKIDKSPFLPRMVTKGLADDWSPEGALDTPASRSSSTGRFVDARYPVSRWSWFQRLPDSGRQKRFPFSWMGFLPQREGDDTTWEPDPREPSAGWAMLPGIRPPRSPDTRAFWKLSREASRLAPHRVGVITSSLSVILSIRAHRYIRWISG